MILVNLLPFGAVLFACVQATFLQPYMIVAQQRINLFTTFVTMGVLLVVAACHLRRPTSPDRQWHSWEPWAWLGLGSLVMLSGYLGVEQPSSLYRAIAFWGPALAGYWCGRLMFDNAYWVRFCEVVFTSLFFVVSVVQIWQGAGPSFLGVHHHAMVNLLLLLAVGPLSLFVRMESRIKQLLFLSILAAGFAATFLIGSRFAVLLPFVLLPLLVTLRFIKKRYATCALVGFVAVAAAFFISNPEKIMKMHNYESVFYRVEGVPASLHVAKHNLFFGIGIRTPREPYLEDYTLRTNMTDKKEFLRIVRNNVTADNMLITMIVGLGVVPTIVYIAMLAVYGRRLARSLRQRLNVGLATPAIGLVLVASLVHWTVQDGLLYPQIGWLFHLLLGMIPLSKTDCPSNKESL